MHKRPHQIFMKLQISRIIRTVISTQKKRPTKQCL